MKCWWRLSRNRSAPSLFRRFPPAVISQPGVWNYKVVAEVNGCSPLCVVRRPKRASAGYSGWRPLPQGCYAQTGSNECSFARASPRLAHGSPSGNPQANRSVRFGPLACYLGNWNHRDLHRSVFDIQLSRHQHHGREHECQHCAGQLGDIVHACSIWRLANCVGVSLVEPCGAACCCSRFWKR